MQWRSCKWQQPISPLLIPRSAVAMKAVGKLMVPWAINFLRVICLRTPRSSTGNVKCQNVRMACFMQACSVCTDNHVSRRKKGQGTQSEVRRRDLKRELEERERRATKAKASKSAGIDNQHTIHQLPHTNICAYSAWNCPYDIFHNSLISCI